MSQTKPGRRVIVFDFETTGLSPKNGDRVIEIGAVAIENGRLTDEFQSLIYTDRRIHWAARRVHRISNKMLTGQPSAAQIFSEFHRFIAADPLIAHNAAFDLRFLTYELSQLGLTLENSHQCTLKLSRKYNQILKSHKLENVARHLLGADAIANINLHRALDDARLTAKVWLKMIENHFN